MGGNPLFYIDPLGLAQLTFLDPVLEAVWNNAILNTPTGAKLAEEVKKFEGPDIVVQGNSNCTVRTVDPGRPSIDVPERNPKNTVVNIDSQVMFEVPGTKGSFWVGLPHILVHEVSHGIGAGEKGAIENWENNFQLDVAGPRATERVVGAFYNRNQKLNEKCGCDG